MTNPTKFKPYANQQLLRCPFEVSVAALRSTRTETAVWIDKEKDKRRQCWRGDENG